MSQTILPRQPVLQPLVQQIEYVLNALHDRRLLPGLIISLVLITLMLVRPAAFGELTGLHAETASAEVEKPVTEVAVGKLLTPQMRAALNFASRKYRVSAEALEPAFVAAQKSARETRLDPLLIVAVISIESRFNPYAESVVGAQGLMQVMPRWHQDKIPDDMGSTALFDAETNVRVGAQILNESIRREGGLIAGLQQFAGARNDPELNYANKVLAEKRQIESAIGREGRTRRIEVATAN